MLNEDATDKAYVEVERGRNKPEKWRNLHATAGICRCMCGDPGKQEHDYSIEIQPLGFGGVATDLETLKKGFGTEAIQPLWLDKW